MVVDPPRPWVGPWVDHPVGLGGPAPRPAVGPPPRWGPPWVGTTLGGPAARPIGHHYVEPNQGVPADLRPHPLDPLLPPESSVRVTT